MSSENGVRLDKWLWASRLFKTRALAVEAADGGKVHLNGSRAKKSKYVKVGDELRIRKGPYEYQLTVKGLSERRLGAAEAAELYTEDEESETERRKLLDAHRAQAKMETAPRGKPTKRDRRLISKWKRRD